MVYVKILKPCWVDGVRGVPGSIMELPKDVAWGLVAIGKALITPAPVAETAQAPEGESRPQPKPKRRAPIKS